MSEVGSVGVGLSVAFALFMVVLAVELYYVRTSRQKRREAEAGTQVKQKQTQVLWSSSWRHKVGASWSILGAEGAKSWMKPRSGPHSATEAGAAEVEGVLEVVQGKTLEERDEQEEDVLKEGGLWGLPRLLFTIKEETKEELEVELEGWGESPGHGSGSELLQCEASACTSPFVTPLSSPPFATPVGSPAHYLAFPPSCKYIQEDVESSSFSTSASSSPPLPARRPLSALFEDTSSFSSSSSAATPGALSPSAAAPPPSTTSPSKRQHHPLCLLLDPPPSPSSALYHYHNRVHPLTSLPSHYYHMHNVYVGDPVTRPTKHHPLAPCSSFHLPAPSQPTTPCPFRVSWNAKSTAALSPTSLLAEV